MDIVYNVNGPLDKIAKNAIIMVVLYAKVDLIVNYLNYYIEFINQLFLFILKYLIIDSSSSNKCLLI